MRTVTGIKNKSGVFQISVIGLLALVVFVQADDNIIGESALKELHEDNWSDMLKGEWMVEFFAPWCPACKSLAPTWEHFAEIAAELGVNVAKIDVTTSPSLSGRFFVTALPTIYHVKNSEFRQYRGSRDADALVQFIKLKQWQNIEQISSWKNPDTIHMSILSYFFKLSHSLKDFNSRLQEEYGLPSWGSYALFAVGTVFVGATLGLVLVCLVDFLYPPKRSPRQSFAEYKEKSLKEGIEDLAEDDLEDDADENDDNNKDESDEEEIDEGKDEGEEEEDETSEAELISQSEYDSEKSDDNDNKKTEDGKKQVEKEETTNAKNIPEVSEQQKTSPEVRKRKPRKAD